jgi:PIN domain nuclease of toxin-antitoxin system
MEIAIKQSVGKLRLEVPLSEFVDSMVAAGALLTPVTIEHAIALAALPMKHRDPFDRTLIAQAQVEGFTLVTADPRILTYDVPTIDARK